MTTSKIVALVTTIAITFFIIGYSTYPYFHPVVYTKDISPNEIQLQTDTENTPMVSIRQEVKVESSQFNSQSNVSDKSPTTFDADTIESFSDQDVAMDKMNAEKEISWDEDKTEFVEEQANFDQWKKNNKAKILDKLQDVLPESIQDFFTKKVEENDFFSDLEASQHAISDVDWSRIIETKIRDFVTLHKLGSQVEIINLECVQLTCRIFGISSGQHVWNNMYTEMFFLFIKEGFLPNEANTKTGVSYVVDETTYFYSQIAFLKNETP